MFTLAQIPSGSRKVCSPDSREIPAPVRITIFPKRGLLSLLCRTSLRNLPPLRYQLLHFCRSWPLRMGAKEIVEQVGCPFRFVLARIHLSERKLRARKVIRVKANRKEKVFFGGIELVQKSIRHSELGLRESILWAAANCFAVVFQRFL